jgi:hypothetical protein
MANYIFTTPVVEEGPSGQHRLFYFYKLKRGLTITRTGEYYEIGRWFNHDELEAADEYWLGGHEHEVTEATKDALIAGVDDVTEANFRAI